MKVGLFLACFNESLFPETGKSVVKILEQLNCEVDFPLAQTCCGQLQYNSGFQEHTLALARRFVDIFAPYDAVVSPSSSCTHMVKEVFLQLAEDFNDHDFELKVRNLAQKTWEFTEFLVDKLKVTKLGAYYPHTVTYHATCSSSLGLKLDDRPLRLLKQVEGLELVEMESANECCGFGGTFAVKNKEVSTAMLQDKIAAIEAVDVKYCVAVDNSCLMHIGGGLSKKNSEIEVIHLADILASRKEEI